ncbi:hypothetical protein [Desulfogranum japonicum]|uniref:hypothetical protein n=1 Tax=Desulfogranum japonicum TaxID=231447 RepID=UPI000407A866|nr:hypothetical protein [Desulfogranum japonicum]
MVENISPDAEQQIEEDLFATKLDAWRFLRADGWKIGRSQFYEHCSEGLLRPDTGGKYSLKKVEKYARNHLKREETDQKVNEKLERLHEKKARLEVEQAEVKLAREKHDLGIKQKKFIPRDEFELAVVGRAVALLAHLKHMVHTRAADYVELVDGNQELAGDLVSTMEIDIEERCSAFARDVEFDVILEAE